MYYKKHKYDVVVILAVLALCLSLFLAVSEALKIIVPCDLTGGCEAVLTSRYAKVFSLPLSYIGIIYFGSVIVCALLANHYRKFGRFLTWILGSGVLLSLGLLGIQFLVLKSVCQYCLAVDILTIAIFLWDLNIEHISITV